MNEFDVPQSVPKLTEFNLGGTEQEPLPVSFVETLTVKVGVECDVYSLDNDPSKDLAVITVNKEHKTPLQRVLSGVKTTEGFVDGAGTLTITSQEGQVQTYEFGPDQDNQPVEVKIGETMQWSASSHTNLVFYEVCEPPYEDGRYKNLTDQ